MEKLRADVSAAARKVLGYAGQCPQQPALVAIDGRCGAGKTTLAAAIQQAAGAAVVHMDDFFLQAGQRTPARLAEPGGNVDRERLLEEVLRPLREQRPVVYRPYDAPRDAMLGPVCLEPAPVTVIEGSYSCHPALWGYYSLRVFVDVPPGEQLRRIRARNGPGGLEAFRAKWIPLEEAYFRAFPPEGRCDLYIELAPA